MKRKLKRFMAFGIAFVMAFVMTFQPICVRATEFAKPNTRTADNYVVSVSTSSDLSTAITSNGDLYCWGDNGQGQVGNGTYIDQTTPVKVLENVASVYPYGNDVAAITTNGDLYCWGYNYRGEVGNGTTSSQNTPVKVLENVSSFSWHGWRSVAVTVDGDLYCWGQNTYGEAGCETIGNQKIPFKVLENVTSVSHYGDVVAAITANGDLYCWGQNTDGQVGNGSTLDQTTPQKILQNVSSVSYSSSNYVMGAITTDGELYCWGYGSVYTGSYRTPKKILDNVSSCYYDGYISVAITTNLDLYCWRPKKETTPKKMLENVSSVSCGYSYEANNTIAAITTNGDLYCWGNNSSGQVGNGTTTSQTTPVKVLENVSSVSSGWYSSVMTAITTDRSLYCWGRNDHGEIGNGTTEDQTVPLKVLENVSTVSYNRDNFSMAAITTNGELYRWGGNNYYGQIGNGTTEDQTIPFKVMENVISVSQGSSHIEAVTTNGDLYCWGDNSSGQIGNGSTLDQTTPLKVLLDSAKPPINSSSPSNNTNTTAIDNSEIIIQTNDYDTLIGGELEGANTEVEGIGTSITDSKGTAHITNSLTDPSAMKRICVTKDGYRDYIFYTTIVSPEMVSLFSTNQLYACLKKKKAGDDTNPYVSTVMYYRDGVAKTCGGQHFQESDTVTFRACGVWNDKQPGYYCMYQVGGKSFESEDGIFKLNIGDSLSGSDDIYVKMIAKDGTESEPEQVYITVPKGDSNISDDSYIPILNESAESGWQVDVPFLNDDKLSFDIGKIKTTIKRDGSKVRIMLGAETPADSGNIFDDKAWEDWKKFCESQPKDLSLSQWEEVLSSDNLDTHWTSKAKIKATGYGWLENDLSADSTTPLTGGIQVIIDMSTTFKQQYAVGVIPIYLEESIGVKGELGGSVTFDTKEKKFGGKTNAKITPSLSVGGGVGVLYVATVGAEGSASMPMKIDFPKGLTQADLEGSLSLKASVLGFNYSKEMVKATYPLYPSNSNGKAVKKLMKQGSNDFTGDMSLEALYNMDNYVLPEKTESTAKWYGDSTKKKAAKQSSDIASNLTEMLLQTGTSELSEPILVQEGNTILAVFLTEDGSRETIHRTKLVYTVYDEENSTWSSLKAVDEDGTGDFQPYLTASNGHIVASWLNYDSKVTDSSSMKEALQSSEICYAVWSENTKSFVKAVETLSSTESVSYNSTHAYVDTKGNVVEVGLKNTGADIFGTTGNNVLFMTGKSGNKTIDKEFTLTQGIPVTYDVTGTEEVVTVAVCLDTDRDLTTLEDREIYLFSSNGTVKRLTDNNTYDSSPQYAKYQGKNALFWYTEQGYKVLDADDKESDIMKDDNTSISENFTVVNGENKETAIVWSSADEDSVYQLTACIYDEDLDRWSRQVVLSDSEENIFRPSGYFNADGDMEFLYRKGSTVDKGSLYTLQVSQAPDLEIIDAYIKDGTAIPSKETKVYVAVRNLGTSKITDYSISVDGQTTYVSSQPIITFSGAESSNEQKAEDINSILPGESKLLEVSYTLPETVSYGEISVEVNVTDDRDTSNNTFSLVMGYSDVSVSATEEELGNGRIVHVTVQNTETVSTDAVLEVHKDTKDGELLSSMKLGNLKQGDIVTTDFIYPKQGSDYEVDADALYYVVTSSAVEKYESNNYDYTVFNAKESGDSGDITPTPSPDNTTTPTQKPSVTPTQKPDSQPGEQTPTPFPSSTVMPTNQPTVLPTDSSTIIIGTKTTVGKMKYKVTKVNNNGTGKVTLIGTTRKKSDKRFTSLKVGNTVKIRGKSFKITAIGNNAFRGYKQLKSVTVGKNVKKIGTKAFYGCKKLKKIVINTTQLQAKKVGSKAFKGIYFKVNIKVPKPKLKSYKKILRAKGVGKRAKIHT